MVGHGRFWGHDFRRKQLRVRACNRRIIEGDGMIKKFQHLVSLDESGRPSIIHHSHSLIFVATSAAFVAWVEKDVSKFGSGQKDRGPNHSVYRDENDEVCFSHKCDHLAVKVVAGRIAQWVENPGDLSTAPQQNDKAPCKRCPGVTSVRELSWLRPIPPGTWLHYLILAFVPSERLAGCATCRGRLSAMNAVGWLGLSGLWRRWFIAKAAAGRRWVSDRSNGYV